MDFEEDRSCRWRESKLSSDSKDGGVLFGPSCLGKKKRSEKYRVPVRVANVWRRHVATRMVTSRMKQPHKSCQKKMVPRKASSTV